MWYSKGISLLQISIQKPTTTSPNSSQRISQKHRTRQPVIYPSSEETLAVSKWTLYHALLQRKLNSVTELMTAPLETLESLEVNSNPAEFYFHWNEPFKEKSATSPCSLTKLVHLFLYRYLFDDHNFIASNLCSSFLKSFIIRTWLEWLPFTWYLAGTNRFSHELIP